MDSRAAKIDTGISVSLITSAVIHLAVFLLMVWWGQLFPPEAKIRETYYVDVVSLPVLHPQSGSSMQKPADVGTPSPPPPAPPVMVSRQIKSTPKVIAKPKPGKPLAQQESAETESAFDERMAKLVSNQEARREEAVIDRLRNKVKAVGSSKVGSPTAGGTESGSRYVDYIKSRLEDALKVTNSYTTKSPEVAVRLTIAGDGKLSRMKVERSSGDTAFELAVRRAIDLASEKFTAPPNHTVFESGFVFKPKGITNGTLR
jgi:colicin import membrane protein